MKKDTHEETNLVSENLSSLGFVSSHVPTIDQSRDFMEMAFCCVARFSGAVARQAGIVEALAHFRATFDLTTIVIQRLDSDQSAPRRVVSVGLPSFSADHYRADSFNASLGAEACGSVQTARSSTGGIVLQIILQTDASGSDVALFEFPRLADSAQIAALAAMAPSMIVAWEMRQPGFVSALIHARSPKRKTPSSFGQEADILSMANPYQLSRAEFRVCRLLAEGLKPQLIAQELGLSITTIRTHLSNIYSKTELSGQLELVSKINRSSQTDLQVA